MLRWLILIWMKNKGKNIMKITKKNLKAILMEEVESILQERETDSVYTELIELFMSSWLLPDNLAVGREKKSKTLY